MTMPMYTRAVVVGAVGLALVGQATVRAAPATVPPEQPAIGSTQAVYAAFTLNLIRFVTWPETAFADPAAPLVIGTFPRDPINEHLDAAAAREKDTDRPIRPIRLQSLDDVTKCHVIFLPKSHARQGAVLRRAAGKPILMIGDADGFLERGGHVRFESEPSQTRLRISVENLKASGLTGRSQLLRLAAQ